MQHGVMLSLTLLVFLCVAEQGSAGPFGLAMGMKPEDCKGELKKEDQPGMYSTTTVPNAQGAFARYYLLFGPQSGLCQIGAMGQRIPTGVDGDKLRSAFDAMAKRLTRQYGKGRRTDSLRPGSMWNDPTQFMMGLRKGERLLSVLWRKNSVRLKDNLSGVLLRAHAHSLQAGFLTVSYKFENHAQCEQELQALSAGGPAF